MAKRAENEGFRMLDDFVCGAIPEPGIPQADPRKQGKNEGIRVVEELVFGGESEGKEEGGAEGKERDRPKQSVDFADVAAPIRPGWLDLFSRAPAGAAFHGIVGAVLGVIGAVAAPRSSLEPGQVADPVCRFCGRSDAQYRLKCCGSPTCEKCLSKMFSPEREEGVAFRCSACGHVHSEPVSA